MDDVCASSGGIDRRHVRDLIRPIDMSSTGDTSGTDDTNGMDGDNRLIQVIQ
ncbi:hypothetical protein HYG81_05420 [Natrinema zhouii]|uniref:Uncharacterized protein n=1 Tax=Natrinema zhouii TaxID=1710539 RepID=A0A7D6CRP4_9EURY|nr:hypothetical protein [Natrinema zhouii]QLK27049.1 hypothetical protein HYG81_05420 [Natrinema zhouii]